MNEIVAKLSSKNQVTIPAEVRQKLGIGAHDRVSFVITNGSVTLERPRYTLRDVLGSVKALPGETLDLDQEIDRAKAEAISARYREERHS